ncbi:hypothetical protein SIN8267_02192 [Sinobacterium norvegicum]|uniref:HTH tetR-type domain-containing protein n=1 Tax=Sinobacterium norvegicum TaxID=1641715 RepID=A0ABN8EMG0_9GAMM|nr:TetR/AcrR family transcriptional regulator [Sinobacterium norvegicum]CAH0992077.1 hypothetical protein SIN8267_02192 [Sinobacterium norvegicum]
MAKTKKSTDTLNRIIDAAIACYQRDGLQQTNLEGVAKYSGISRATVYRHANNKRQLLDRVIERESQQSLIELRKTLAGQSSLHGVVTESIIFIMQRRHHYPMQALLFGDESGNQQQGNLNPHELYQTTYQSLQHNYDQAKANGEVADNLSLEILSDWVSRLMHSLVSYPGEYGTDEAKLRHYLRVVVSPVLEPRQ